MGYTVVSSYIQPSFNAGDIEAVLMELAVRDPLFFWLAIYGDDRVLVRFPISQIS